MSVEVRVDFQPFSAFSVPPSLSLSLSLSVCVVLPLRLVAAALSFWFWVVGVGTGEGPPFLPSMSPPLSLFVVLRLAAPALFLLVLGHRDWGRPRAIILISGSSSFFLSECCVKLIFGT